VPPTPTHVRSRPESVFGKTSASRSGARVVPLRQLANRLVGILHGCLMTSTLYDEHTAWLDQQQSADEHITKIAA
jgi:hypothetical protein